MVGARTGRAAGAAAYAGARGLALLVVGVAAAAALWVAASPAATTTVAPGASSAVGPA